MQISSHAGPKRTGQRARGKSGDGPLRDATIATALVFVGHHFHPTMPFLITQKGNSILYLLLEEILNGGTGGEGIFF